MTAKVQADLLIIGMGAAAQLCALYAHDANPNLNIVIATKALKGKGGCSRMVQGGFNVVLNSDDAIVGRVMSDGFEVLYSNATLVHYFLCIRPS